MSRTPLAALACIALLGLCRPGRGQEQTLLLKANDAVPDARAVAVTMRSFGSTGRVGGCGFVQLTVDNRAESPHQLVVSLIDRATEGNRLAVRRSLAVEAGRSERLLLPLPGLPLPLQVGFEVDPQGPLPQRASGRLPLLQPSGNRLTVLGVGLGSTAAAAFGALRAFDSPVLRGHEQLDCTAADLPERWTMLSAFDLVVVDGADPGLTAPVQQLLLDHAAAGGRLLVVGPERLPRTAAAVLREAAEPFQRHGFGAVGALPLDLQPPALAARQKQLKEWLTDGAWSVVPWLLDGVAGPVPRSLHAPVQLPGVAGIPTNLFFLITVLFVLLAGPVNHVWCQRRGRPWLVLLTVPVGGFVVAGSIVGCSLWREGFRSQGALATMSWLDQRDHSVAVLAASTVFAANSPAVLQPQPDSWLSADELLADERDGRPPALRLDADQHTLDGALLPSRQPTGFAVMTRRLCRERLRFQRGADGALQLLDGPGLAVRRQTGALVLHDFDGKWYQLRSDGVLLPVAAGDAMRTAALALEQLQRLPARQTRRRGSPSAGLSAAGFLHARLLGHLQRPGSYCALVQQPPDLDPFGLEVDWGVAAHLVVGTLAAEDLPR